MLKHVLLPFNVLLAVTITSGLFAQSSATTATAAPGTALGATIKGVIETVFPAITPIVDLFRPKQNNKEKEDKQQADIASKIADLKRATKQQLAPVAALSEELAVIDTIAGNAAIAEISLAQINVMLAMPVVSDKTWEAIKEEWSNATKALAKVDAIDSKKILDTVKDDAIQARLLDARALEEEASNRIQQRLPGKDAPHIREQTLKLQDALLAARNLSTIKLARLSRELKVVQDYLSTGQGTEAPALPIPADYLDLTDRALARAKNIKDN